MVEHEIRRIVKERTLDPEDLRREHEIEEKKREPEDRKREDEIMKGDEIRRIVEEKTR